MRRRGGRLGKTFFGRGDRSRSELTARRRGRLGRRVSSVEALEPRSLLAADLLISEFLADNESGLKDEDGDTSDWIELYNRGAEPVDLDGWHLTDDSDDLDKWEFPSRVLTPGQSLIVFASNKDRDGQEGPLHTNFGLSANGEYLALVSPDGSTVVDEYDPYPPQYADVSYGPEQSEQMTTLVSATTPSRLRLPGSVAEDIPTETWTAADYDDASWRSVPAAIGYDAIAADGDFAALIAPGGSIPEMQGQTASAYLRSDFEINGELPALDELNLNLNFDDGFVAFLNGVPVASRNAPETLAWNSTATAEHGGVTAALQYPNFSDPDAQADFNLVGDASWTAGRLQLTPSTVDQTGAAWLREPLTFGPDYTFSAAFVINAHTPGGTSDSDGRGGHGMTFVLQNGGANVLGGPAGQLGLDSTGTSFVAVEFDTFESGSFDPNNDLPSHVGIDTSRDGNVARAAVPRFNGHVAIPAQPGPGVDLRYAWIDFNGSTNQMAVYFAETDVRPAEPTLTATVDLADLFGGVPELTVGFTAATGTAYNAQDVRRFEFTSGAGQLGLSATPFNLKPHQSLLRLGGNVLAIHGLNVSADDADFLVRPELVGVTRQVGEAKYFSPPTPGELNGPGEEAPTGAVRYSRTTQTFVSPFQLELIPPKPNAVIRYTTNGAIPDETSILYTGPLQISTTTRIRARAFETGRGPGPVQSESFIAIDSSLASFESGQPFDSNLPLMIFESFGRNVESSNRLMVPVSGVFIDPGEDGRSSILDLGEFAGRGGMRIRGQTSEGFAKKQFALELWDEFNSDTQPLEADRVADKSASFFGLPSESDWVLNGPYSDKTQLNNYLTFLWSNKAGTYAPRARLVEVFLNQNGGKLNYSQDYRGTYVLLEKIKRDDDRVDIAPLTPDDNAYPAISGGYIWKKDKAGAEDVPFTTSRGQELRMVEPDDSEITAPQKNWLRDYINQFETALYGPNFADPAEGYQKFIDVGSWVDTWLLVEMTKNIDGFRLSTYYHKDREGKIQQGPAWDYNLSLGNGNYLNGAYPEGWYHNGIGANDYPYWDRLFEDPNFAQRVVDRWHELRSTVWSTENLLADIDQAVELLSDGNPRLENPTVAEGSNPISRNFDKWGTLNSYLWPNCFFGQGSCPSSPLPNGARPSKYADYIFIMKDFIERRTAWIDTQFPRGPELTPSGGLIDAGTTVSIDVPAGWQGLYTLDGTDPRAPIAVGNEELLLASRTAAQILVPESNSLINACAGSTLANPTACFINPAYVGGTHGESWIQGPLGVGYERSSGYDPFIGTDVEAQMYDANTSVYVRIPFQVTASQLNSADGLQMRVRYDDGFVAYLWSDRLNRPVEMARDHAPGNSQASPIDILSFDAAASASNADSAAVNWAPFDVSHVLPDLRVGTNYLIVQGLNVSPTSSDFLFDVELAGTRASLTLPEGVFEYEGPIPIDHNTQLTARLLRVSNQTWSGASAALYVTSTPRVAISEVNYHPGDPSFDELTQVPTLDQDDFEFVELLNVGNDPAYLVGSSFDSGVEFSFDSQTLEPGEYAVVVKNEAAFRLRYGQDARILGQFEGALNNGGELLRLVDGVGREIAAVEYGDGSLWPEAADGVGATLVMNDPFQTPPERFNKYYSWRSSTEVNGSPGRAGLAAVPVVINEVLSNTDLVGGLTDSIELHNVSGTLVDLSGWYVSDSRNQLLKYRIPNGTILPPGGYLVLDESDFNPTPEMPADHHFSLNGTLGDDVWVVQVDGDGAVNRFVDHVDFGPTDSDKSLGRIPDGSGFLTALLRPTLGRVNESPRVGPVLLTEVMYQPGIPSAAAIALDPTIASGDLEFLEITNSATVPLDLTNWRLRGGVDFEFPSGRSLAAGQSLLIVPFNPGNPLNASRLAAFRAHYGVSELVPIVGGYTGQLSSNGERISLERPGPPDPDEPAIIPRIVQDEVVYDNLAPWPVSAAGSGDSLQRSGRQAYGNAPQSWVGATPTAGSFDPGDSIPGDFNGDGKVDVADLNLFCAGFQANPPDPKFDLTGDGTVDESDRDRMVRDILGTDYGDADLDGRFDSTDLVVVFQAGQYEDGIAGNSMWGTGDWNCDGDFDTSDLVLAFQTGAYDSPAARASWPTAVAGRAAADATDIALAVQGSESATGSSRTREDTLRAEHHVCDWGATEHSPRTRLVIQRVDSLFAALDERELRGLPTDNQDVDRGEGDEDANPWD